MTITLGKTIKLGERATSEIISGNRVSHLYSVMITGFSGDEEVGLKLVSGHNYSKSGYDFEVKQTCTNSSISKQTDFLVKESDGSTTLPLTSDKWSLSLVAFDKGGNSKAIDVALVRQGVSVIDVVVDKVKLTDSSVFKVFADMGIAIADGQQLQYENHDDSGNAIIYSDAGILETCIKGRSKHRVTLWDNGNLYETYVKINNDGLPAKPVVSIMKKARLGYKTALASSDGYVLLEGVACRGMAQGSNYIKGNLFDLHMKANATAISGIQKRTGETFDGFYINAKSVFGSESGRPASRLKNCYEQALTLKRANNVKIDSDVQEGMPIKIYTGEGYTGTPQAMINNVSVPVTGSFPNLVVPTELASLADTFHGFELDTVLNLTIFHDAGHFDNEIIIRSLDGYERVQMTHLLESQEGDQSGGINTQVDGVVINHNAIMYYPSGQGLVIYENGDYEYSGGTLDVLIGKRLESGIQWYPYKFQESSVSESAIPVPAIQLANDITSLAACDVPHEPNYATEVNGDMASHLVVSSEGNYTLYYHVSDEVSNSAELVTQRSNLVQGKLATSTGAYSSWYWALINRFWHFIMISTTWNTQAHLDYLRGYPRYSVPHY
ncbi:hypothetical protein [Marinomonas transparens]|uniref:Uncharacterized protein n=1 Tax=Marinomonas transparens TaxID=2795388 RepID=A0A934JQX4_9GAMM|nr:hypothetical protein [Marinomonas transparens]MBJ7538158.1 hypothetical protein [Marinomonas transparens]